jgi:transposase, IS5 family
MYRNDSHTPTFPEFGLPFGGYLDPNNRWVRKSALIPWKIVEREYRNQLSGSSNGSPALTARMAFAALVIKEELNLTDRETVEQIRENPYLQFFAGLESFQTEEPFDASMMVHFRKRFPLESMNRINEAMTLATTKSEIKKSSNPKDPSPEDSMNSKSGEQGVEEETAEPENQGKLLIDATCTPADIRYPTDLSLLNEAREKTEKIIDRLHKNRPKESKKPRTYRQRARKEYLAVAKKKSKSAKMIRKAIRKQLGYVRRNLEHIRTLSQTVSFGVLKRSLYRELLVISELYRQQKIMYDLKQKRIDDRIVSIWFPHVRPIKRGKANADTEFGAKVHLSLVNGFAFAERIDWNNFNEGAELISAIQAYRRRFGFFPKSVHADKIYRNRKNRDYCKEHGIRLSGPFLGRPPKDETLRQEQKKLARQDETDRIPVEGKFGQGKRRYGLARIMAKLAETSLTVIGMNLLVMNMEKMTRLLSSSHFFLLIYLWMERRYKAVQAVIRTKWRCCLNFFWRQGPFRRIAEPCTI